MPENLHNLLKIRIFDTLKAFSVQRSAFSVQRSAFSVQRSAFSVLADKRPCTNISSELHGRRLMVFLVEIFYAHIYGFLAIQNLKKTTTL